MYTFLIFRARVSKVSRDSITALMLTHIACTNDTVFFFERMCPKPL